LQFIEKGREEHGNGNLELGHFRGASGLMTFKIRLASKKETEEASKEK
jgi:hypothetical protein